jgi:hypothetical protein
MDLTRIRWRKSSYSGADGGNCVEVGTGTRVKWRKSSHSGPNGGDCVEVGTVVCAVAVRDSKDPGGGALTVSPQTWLAFTRRLQQS